MRYAEEAYRVIDFHLVAGSKDPSLAQAAIILGCFEMLPHVKHSSARMASALMYIDTCAQACLLTHLDAQDPHVSRDIVGLPRSRPLLLGSGSESSANTVAGPPPAWSNSPAWSREWGQAEIQKEEMRRMCWTASSLAAQFSLWAITVKVKPLHTSVSKPHTFALLFPGEAAFQQCGDVEQGKATTWALYQRLITLWQYIHNETMTEDVRQRILAEVSACEADLAAYARRGRDKYIWHARNWAFLVRRDLGAIDRSAIADWFDTQSRILLAFDRPTPGMLPYTERPNLSWWYIMLGMNALQLCRLDTACRPQCEVLLGHVYKAVDHISEVFPCAGLEEFMERLREMAEKMALRPVWPE